MIYGSHDGPKFRRVRRDAPFLNVRKSGNLMCIEHKMFRRAICSAIALFVLSGCQDENPPSSQALQSGDISADSSKESFPQSPNGPKFITFQDINLSKIPNMNPVPINVIDSLPERIKNLNGKRIRIRGYMRPTFEEKNLEQFVMEGDLDLFHFGRPRKAYELIHVNTKPDKRCDYIHSKPFDVIGTFRIEEIVDDGMLLGLYWIVDGEAILDEEASE